MWKHGNSGRNWTAVGRGISRNNLVTVATGFQLSKKLQKRRKPVPEDALKA